MKLLFKILRELHESENITKWDPVLVLIAERAISIAWISVVRTLASGGRAHFRIRPSKKTAAPEPFALTEPSVYNFL